ncbi:hypothetical protein BCV70DRAFT_207080 [Testicularia cyperi]|uniref:Uncharacterized protein n=1 Tax=Testicularia cyperi TaxID=1882483 RepID=A0A317XQ70_9BASI|nr:hypothetical protein BCV70DRAFT_207080 [Testicularia cyperi]
MQGSAVYRHGLYEDMNPEFKEVFKSEAERLARERRFLWKSSDDRYWISTIHPSDEIGHYLGLPEYNSLGLVYWYFNGHELELKNVSEITGLNQALLNEIVRGFRG